LGSLCARYALGNYRVNFRDGNETTVYYTDKLEDAVNAVVAMARKRALCAATDRRARHAMTAAYATHFWQRRTNVWREVTSPTRGSGD
jgi:hypothetical protein